MNGKMLSKHIKELQELLDTEGDMVCIYAKDDEGNDYRSVCYEPCVMFSEDSETFEGDAYSEANVEEDEMDTSNLIKVVCIN